MIPIQRSFPIACLLVGLWTSAAVVWACDDMTVRDSAFQERRDVHRMSIVAAADDASADETYRRLSRWLAGPAKGINIELHRLDPEDSEVRWTEFGIPSAPGPEQIPAVVLAGHQHAAGRTFFIDYWQPAPTDEDLAAMTTSPVREELQKTLPKSIAALLYLRGTGPEAGSAEKTVESFVAERFNLAAPLSVVHVDRNDPKERMIVSFTGAGPEGPDWVGVVFGRGKFANPPLQGSEITASTLGQVVDSITAKCTCLEQASKMGVDIPMRWDESLDKQYVNLTVVTPDDSEGDESPSVPVTADAEDELEVLLASDSVKTTAPLALAASTPSEDSAASNRSLLGPTFWVLAAVVVVLAASTIGLMRRRSA